MVGTSHELIAERETLLPWLAASLLTLAAFVVGVLAGTASSDTQRVMLTVAVCAVVTATQLVLYRSRRHDQEARRQLRTRPASDELDRRSRSAPAVSGERTTTLPPYAAGMLRYAEAVVELLEHGVEVALRDDVDPTELATGRDDAAALKSLLTSMAAEPVHLHKAAKVHTICSLWEAGQARLERMVADLDPEFHRAWRTRNVAALRMRHGEAPQRDDMVLPYRGSAGE